MGVLAKVLLQESEEKCCSNEDLLEKVAEAEKKKQQKASKTEDSVLHEKRKLLLNKRVSHKKIRSQPLMERRSIRKLKKLIPNSESVELNGLFRETADYILCLQMKVRLMQVLVNALKD